MLQRMLACYSEQKRESKITNNHSARYCHLLPIASTLSPLRDSYTLEMPTNRLEHPMLATDIRASRIACGSMR